MGGGANDADETTQLAPGTRVGLYTILNPIGQGGVGTVYLAEFGSAREHVAVKVLRPEFTENPELIARFEREAGAMAGLIHENIVRAFDIGRTAAGAMFMVMELASGESLRTALIRSGALGIEDAVSIAQQVCAAMVRAHAVGVIHRDLKPENIMVSGLGTRAPVVKVLDFGMARLTNATPERRSKLTAHGTILGSPSYMPPEQALARPADGRADQYALGVMLFEMLAGRKPFVAKTTLELLQMQIRTPPPPLKSVMPDAPPGLSAVVDRLLSKRPEERYEDAATLLAALNTWQNPQPAPAPRGTRRSTVPKAKAKGRPRKVSWVLVAVAAAVALLATLAIAQIARGHSAPPAGRPQSSR